MQPQTDPPYLIVTLYPEDQNTPRIWCEVPLKGHEYLGRIRLPRTVMFRVRGVIDHLDAANIHLAEVSLEQLPPPSVSPSPTVKQPTTTPTPAAMTNAELRAATGVYLARLRRFNSEFRDMNQREEDADRTKFNAIMREKDEAKTHTAWEVMTNKSLRRSAKFRETFRANFLVDAQVLDQQLRKRADPAALVTDYPLQRGQDVLDTGSLAGPDPVGDLATYLERLEKHLPEDSQ